MYCELAFFPGLLYSTLKEATCISCELAIFRGLLYSRNGLSDTPSPVLFRYISPYTLYSISLLPLSLPGYISDSLYLCGSRISPFLCLDISLLMYFSYLFPFLSPIMALLSLPPFSLFSLDKTYGHSIQSEVVIQEKGNYPFYLET